MQVSARILAPWTGHLRGEDGQPGHRVVGLPTRELQVTKTPSQRDLLDHVSCALVRYQLLAVAGVEATGDGSNDKPKTDHIVTGRRVTADWNLGLGEACIDLQVINSDKRDTPSTIVALCSRYVQLSADALSVTLT